LGVEPGFLLRAAATSESKYSLLRSLPGRDAERIGDDLKLDVPVLCVTQNICFLDVKEHA
jgi:hypothetical protein